ncbi:MAG: ABC transporter substrate-binding protein [Planctomycetes bacterium]|nr:ABC transporter substrate-binding protein [Planctomycetota bacterium]
MSPGTTPSWTPRAAVAACALFSLVLAACSGDVPQGRLVNPADVKRAQPDKPVAPDSGTSKAVEEEHVEAARLDPPADMNDPRAKIPAYFQPVQVEPPFDADCTGLYGGTVTLGLLGETIDTFNPLTSNEATSSELSGLVFDTLTSYDSGAWRSRPSLAWKWEVSPDYLTWTFHLRKGVRFSDGTPMTAKDVVFSFEKTCFNPKIANSAVDGFKIGDAPLPTFQAVDDHTVIAKCAAIDALFLDHCSGVPIVPSARWKDAVEGDQPAYNSAMGAEHPEEVIGTGPYRVIQYATGEKIVYEPNPYSWRTAKNGQRLPYAERIVAKLVKDNTTRTLQFLGGGFDLMDSIQVVDFPQFSEKEKEGWFDLHRLGLSLNVTWLSFNQNPGMTPEGKPKIAPYRLKWFQDERFRRAVNHAVDRDQLVKNILDGRGEAIWSDTPRSNKSWFSEVTRFTYAPAKANALLDGMGLAKRDSDGIRLDAEGHRVSFDLMTNVENPIRIKVIAQLKDFLAAVGVEAQLKPAAFQEISKQLDDVHQWEAMVLGWGSAVPPDPLNGKNIHLSSGRLHVWYPQQPKPFRDWETAADSIISMLDRNPDPEARRPLWALYLQLQANQQSTIYLYAPNEYAASRSRIHNRRPSLLRPSTWWNFEELWTVDGK